MKITKSFIREQLLHMGYFVPALKNLDLVRDPYTGKITKVHYITHSFKNEDDIDLSRVLVFNIDRYGVLSFSGFLIP